MACLVVGAKPLSERMLEYCWLDPMELQWKFDPNSIHTFSFKEDPLENVLLKMATILPQPRVDDLLPIGTNQAIA